VLFRSDLTQLLHNETIQNQNSTINLIVVMLLAFLGFFLIIYYISYRHTLKSVAELQKGLHIIGKGNLDYSIKIRKNDEISEISESVNKMTIQLRDLTNNLKNQERMAAIGQTAGMVGHDIRNPLQAITSDLFLAKTELEDTPNSEQKKNALESLDEIEKNVDYINKIVQDLQDYARPLNPKAEKSDIIEIIKRITKDSKPSNIQVSLKVAEEARKIQADSYYLNRIFYNLITNAIQAMPKGGNLLIESKKEGNDVVLLVTDTGVGIPEEVQAKLFSVMFTTKSKGQGFGLPVVKRMTESLGGTVTFESQVGKGTTFIVRLPQ
jgi:signal transduction histidine kinase